MLIEKPCSCLPARRSGAASRPVGQTTEAGGTNAQSAAEALS